MYIVAIAWGFVTVLMAVAEAVSGSIVGGILTLFFYGVLPLVIVLYLFGTPQRRRNRIKRELEQEQMATAPANDAARGTTSSAD